MNAPLPTVAEILKRRAQEKSGVKLDETSQQDQAPDREWEKVSLLNKAPVYKNLTKNSESPESQLSEKLAKIEKMGKESEVKNLARSLGLPTIDLKSFPINPESLGLIPEQRARELEAIVFFYTGTELRLAAVDPEKPEIKELLFELTERHHANGKLYIVSKDSLEYALKLYASLPKIIPVVKGLQITETDVKKYQQTMGTFREIGSLLKETNVTDIITVIIAAALKVGSSDIHIEAEEKGIVVRFRIDGLLQEVAVLEREQWKKIISRIKLVASLKLNITNRAQDGRFTILQENGKVDVRVSSIPTAFGESVVMRLLNPETIALSFDDLGFRPPVLAKLIKEIERPNGMIVTTGPTGSGKTTTLYAILKKLNTPDVKIITLEDPIEYKVEGINQSQIDSARDYTFASGLRSILRQDPDIVMVGEIRDLETAEVSIQAALTGHLLLSTIHTNDAAGAIPRFLSMGVEPHLLAPAVNAIMGQRLVRKLCKNCRQAKPLAQEMTAEVRKLLSSIPPTSGEKAVDITGVTFYSAVGCDLCHGTGYKGRVGVYEVLIKDAEVEKAILEKTLSEYEIRAIAERQGMLTIAQDGLLKAIEGLTSVEEVKRVVGF